MRDSPDSPYIEFPTVIYRMPPRWTARFCLGIGLFLALVLCFAVPAMSALVSGHVYDQKGNPLPNVEFAVKDSQHRNVQGKNFRTDAAGTYGVYLDPGLYFVVPSNNPQLEGVIKSYPQPAHQDIHLQAK